MAADYLKISYKDLPLQNHVPHCGLLPFCNSELFTQAIIDYKQLTSGDDVKEVYDFTIDTMDINYEFHPGDAIGILPENNPLEIHALMDLLDINECNYTLSIMENTTKKNPLLPAHIPSKGSVKQLFKEYLDIRSVPKKGFLKMLTQHTSNPEEKEELLKLSAPKAEKYNSFIAKEGRTLLTLLRKFPTCKPPLERLLEHLPGLKPRFYSISSSCNSTETLSITFSVVEHDHGTHDADEEVLKGVCSSYLQRLLSEVPHKQKVRFYFRHSSKFLSFESEFNNPLILIGPGTGVAPFRGFLQSQSKMPVGKILLFFGCRYSDRDFLYKDELSGFVENGVLAHLFTAFSRETTAKVYVQDKIREQGKLIAELIMNETAYLRLCGDAKNLTKAVDDALRDILVEHGNLDDGECKDFLKELKESGRYSLDVWV